MAPRIRGATPGRRPAPSRAPAPSLDHAPLTRAPSLVRVPSLSRVLSLARDPNLVLARVLNLILARVPNLTLARVPSPDRVPSLGPDPNLGPVRNLGPAPSPGLDLSPGLVQSQAHGPTAAPASRGLGRAAGPRRKAWRWIQVSLSSTTPAQPVSHTAVQVTLYLTWSVLQKLAAPAPALDPARDIQNPSPGQDHDPNLVPDRNHLMEVKYCDIFNLY